MLRPIFIGNTLPMSYPVCPTDVFQPGQIAQLKVLGNEIVCGVSDGTAPLGIIDDINTNAFTAPSKDEIVIIKCIGVVGAPGHYFAAADTKQELRFSNIVRSSFVSDIGGLILNDVNGVVTVLQGTELNYDTNGDGINDSVKSTVDYIYRIANIPGENTTAGSSRVTVWFQRGIFETDQFDTSARYAVNATLFVSEEGMLTTKQITPSHPGVAMVTGAPGALNPTLEFLWL